MSQILTLYVLIIHDTYDMYKIHISNNLKRDTFLFGLMHNNQNSYKSTYKIYLDILLYNMKSNCKYDANFRNLANINSMPVIFSRIRSLLAQLWHNVIDVVIRNIYHMPSMNVYAIHRYTCY